MNDWKPSMVWTTQPGGICEKTWIDVELLPIPREERGVPSYRASLKWDGCIHLHKYWNGYDPATDKEEGNEDNESYLHICDIDEFIEELQALKRKAVEHFGEGWPD